MLKKSFPWLCNWESVRSNSINPSSEPSKEIQEAQKGIEENRNRENSQAGKRWRNLLLGTGETFSDDFTFESSSLFKGEVLVVLGEAGLALFVHQQHKSNPHFLSFVACTSENRGSFAWDPFKNPFRSLFMGVWLLKYPLIRILFLFFLGFGYFAIYWHY